MNWELLALTVVASIIIGTINRTTAKISAKGLTPTQGCAAVILLIPLGVALSALAGFVEWQLYLFIRPAFDLPLIDFPTAWFGGMLIGYLVRGWTPLRVRVEKD